MASPDAKPEEGKDRRSIRRQARIRPLYKGPNRFRAFGEADGRQPSYLATVPRIPAFEPYVFVVARGDAAAFRRARFGLSSSEGQHAIIQNLCQGIFKKYFFHERRPVYKEILHFHFVRKTIRGRPTRMSVGETLLVSQGAASGVASGRARGASSARGFSGGGASLGSSASAGTSRAEKAVITVKLAHDPDDPVNHLEVRPAYRAIGDEQRLVEAADLQRHELGRRLWHALGEDLANEVAHALEREGAPAPRSRRLKRRRSRRLTIRRSRSALFRRGAPRAADERSRRGATGGIGPDSDKGRSPLGS